MRTTVTVGDHVRPHQQTPWHTVLHNRLLGFPAMAAVAAADAAAARLQAEARHDIGRHLCHLLMCEPHPSDVKHFISLIDPEVDTSAMVQLVSAQMPLADIHVSIAHGLSIKHKENAEAIIEIVRAGTQQTIAKLDRSTIQSAMVMSSTGPGARIIRLDRLHKHRIPWTSRFTDRAMHFYNIHLRATGLGRVEPEHMAEVWLGCMMAWHGDSRLPPLSPFEQSTSDLRKVAATYKGLQQRAVCHAALAAAVVQRLIVVVVSTRSRLPFQLLDSEYSELPNEGLATLVLKFILNPNIPLRASLEHHFDVRQG